jgi:hypothetical protein
MHVGHRLHAGRIGPERERFDLGDEGDTAGARDEGAAERRNLCKADRRAA